MVLEQKTVPGSVGLVSRILCLDSIPGYGTVMGQSWVAYRSVTDQLQVSY